VRLVLVATARQATPWASKRVTDVATTTVMRDRLIALLVAAFMVGKVISSIELICMQKLNWNTKPEMKGDALEENLAVLCVREGYK
jgi:hypothetical protein